MRDCESEILELQTELDKIRGIFEDQTSSVRDKFRSKKLRGLYPFKEGTLGKLRDAVASAEDNLSLVLAVSNLEATQFIASGVDKLQNTEDEKKRAKVLEWLSPTYYHAYQQELSKERVSGTGQWFLDSTEYKVS